MAGETIREFLVALGFNVDESSFKKFSSNTLLATESTLKLGGAVTAVATGVEVMVEKVARKFADLYYAAQQANTTTQSLLDVGHAARQIGLEAGQGTDLIAGLAQAMRMNPGTEGLINQLGVQTRDANGHLRDTSKIFDDLIPKYEKMQRYQALQYGQILGQDPTALNQVLNNPAEFLRGQGEGDEATHRVGLDAKKSSEDFVVFMRHVNDLTLSFTTLADRIGHDWEPEAEKSIDEVNRLVLGFTDFNKELGGTPGKIASIVAAAGGLTAALAFFAKGRALIVGTTDALGDLLGMTLRIAGSPVSAFFYALLGNPGEAGKGEDDYIKQHPEKFGKPNSFSLDDVIKKTENATDNFVSPTGAVGKYQVEPGTAKWMLPGDTAGLNDAQITNKLKDPAFNKKAGDAYIAYLQRKYGNDIDSLLVAYDAGPGRADRFKVDRNPALLPKETQQYLQRAHKFEASEGAYGGVTINQKTDIHVNGAGDPTGTAKAVGDQQSRVNGDLVRNANSAVQ